MEEQEIGLEEDESTQDLTEEENEFTGSNNLSWIPTDLLYYGKVIRRRCKKDKDLVIAITGDEGEGKSTFAIALGYAIDPKFNIVQNMMYSPSIEETKLKVEGLPKYSAIIADEAVKILYKLRWSSKMQIYLNVLYSVARQENKVTILLMPRFIDFNEYFRNHRIKIWIHILGRGIAIIFRKDRSPFAKDCWWFDESQKLIDKGRMRKKIIEISNNNWVDFLSRTRIYAGILTFSDLPEDIKKEYLEEKAKQKYLGLEESGEDHRERLWKGRMQTAIGNLYYSEKFQPKELVKMFGLTNYAFYDFLKKYATENNKPDPREVMKKRMTKTMMKRVNMDSLTS